MNEKNIPDEFFRLRKQLILEYYQQQLAAALAIQREQLLLSMKDVESTLEMASPEDFTQAREVIRKIMEGK